MKKKQDAPYPLRLGEDLKQRVSLDAKKAHQSINSWLKTAAEQRLQRSKEVQA